MSKKNSFVQVGSILALAALGIYGYSYYSQKNYGTPKTQVGQRATSDPISQPKIMHTPTPDKTMSAFEQSVTNPSKNGTNRTYA